ncbi:MAG: hypothetical protein AB8G22_06300 [Saprospiraceae bacterium]
MRNHTPSNQPSKPSLFNPFNFNPMRNLFVLFSFLVLVAMFSSCGQDDLFDTEDTLNPTTLAENNAAEDADAVSPTKEDFGFSGKEEIFNEELTLRKEEVEAEVTFDGEAAANSVNSRNPYELYLSSPPAQMGLSCGKVLYDNTIAWNKHNTVPNGFYNYFGFNSNLNGKDNVYTFHSAHDQQVTFQVSQTNRNLAMFLFEGTYAVPYVNVQRVVAYSTSTSIYGEGLYNIHLEAGKSYVLIVDGAPYNGSSYRLDVSCYNPNQHCDNFQGRTLGQGIAHQNPARWTKWSNSSLDLPVEGGSAKYLKVQRNNWGSSQPDVIFKTGTLHSGRYKMSMDMWVYAGETAYFNIQKQLRNEWGAEVYFNSNGTGRVRVKGVDYTFYYPQSTWFECELIFNFNTDRVGLYINGSQATSSWKLSAQANSNYGSHQIQGIDFYAHANNSRYWIDNLCIDAY